MDPEFELTDEERKLLQDAEGMGGFGQALGGTIGGLGGTALSFAPPLAPFAPLIVPAAGALGSWIGGSLGGAAAQDAAKKFEAARAQRLAPLEEQARRQARTSELLGAWLRIPGL